MSEIQTGPYFRQLQMVDPICLKSKRPKSGLPKSGFSASQDCFIYRNLYETVNPKKSGCPSILILAFSGFQMSGFRHSTEQ